MKFTQVLGAAAATLSGLASAVPAGYNVPPFVVGRQFFLNGRVQRFAATNAWWLGHLTSDADVDTATSQIASSGIQVVRVWGFGNSNTNDSSSVYYQLITPSGTSINYGSNGIARLDSAIKHAEKYGLKLVLPMVNNWDDLGGINTYSAAFGSNATTFYTDAKAQAAYRSWIKFAVNRYKNSPAIFAWELANEPRCHGCPSSVITNWATETSKYIKSLDPAHMVTLGDEGWFNGTTYGDGSYGYGGVEGVDFEANLRIKTLDYGVLHLYPDSWGYNQTWGNEWISQHGDAGKRAGKPVILEEYGHNGTDAERLTGTLQWQATARSAGLAVDQFWQFGTKLPSGAALDDAYTIYYNTTKGSLYEQLVIQDVKKAAAAPLLF